MGKPKIRFKGYEDDWEQRKLNEVAGKICVGFVGTCEKFYTDESGIPMYRTGNLNGLSLNRDDLKYVTNEFHQHNQKSQLKAGDILIARHGDSGKAVNYENSEEANCLNIVIIRPDFKKCNYKFLTNCINSPECQKHIKSLSAGSTQAVINTSEIEKLGVVIPANIDEQNRIARYFFTLDHLITLHQRKCEETKSLKKYMLQKMFPENGNCVPKIRFSGFADDWEQRKLGEIATEIYGGGTPKTSNEEFWKGDIPWIQSSDLIDECLFDVRPRKCISQEAVSKSATKLVPQNSIAIVTRVGVGKLAFMPFSYATSQDFLSISELKTAPEFTVYALYRMMQLVSNEVQGTSIKGITKDELLAKKIIFPSCNEQKKIGAYLHNLDHLITLHQHKCDELQKLKKFMLQNMFV